MFSVGQTIVLGLAGAIYVVGAALLLGGRVMLGGTRRAPGDGEGGRTVRAGTRDGTAYFVPGPESRPSGSPSPAGAKVLRPDDRAAAVRTGSPSGRRGVASKRETSAAPAPLETPICLN